jgi:cytochrome c553
MAQFKAFHDPGQEDPHATAAMWDAVRSVDAATLAQIAAYYAQLPPTPPRESGHLAAEGRKLFENGDPAERIAACQSCHGARGQGRGAVPRLAGQHGEYLKNQLDRLRFGLRASGVMHPKTNAITDSQIEELVAYLAGN